MVKWVYVAIDALQRLLMMPGMQLLSIPPDFFVRWLELLQQRPVTGGDVFDVQIVAVMLSNQVHRIYTYNRKDFESFTDVVVLTP